MAEASLDEILEKISKSPEIIEKISSATTQTENNNTYDKLTEIMSAILPVINDDKSDEKEEKTDTPPVENDSNQYEPFIAGLGKKVVKNSKLLLALKPYLNHERQEIIDTVMKLAQVSDLIKLMK